MKVGLRDGRGSREAERLRKLSDPNHLIRTMPAKGDHRVDPYQQRPAPARSDRPRTRWPFDPALAGAQPTWTQRPPISIDVSEFASAIAVRWPSLSRCPASGRLVWVIDHRHH
jgi:hypothetical protein